MEIKYLLYYSKILKKYRNLSFFHTFIGTKEGLKKKKEI